jgi:hypothetical protein
MKTKFGVALILFAGLAGLAAAQENSPAQPASSPPIGLAIGERAPAFTARDQFGQEQSNQSLRGTAGTVLLFFRSADW